MAKVLETSKRCGDGNAPGMKRQGHKTFLADARSASLPDPTHNTGAQQKMSMAGFHQHRKMEKHAGASPKIGNPSIFLLFVLHDM